jgi:hypothetical protein
MVAVTAAFVFDRWDLEILPSTAVEWDLGKKGKCEGTEEEG